MFIIKEIECENSHEVAQADSKQAAEKLRDSLAKQWKAEYVVEESEQAGLEDLND